MKPHAQRLRTLALPGGRGGYYGGSIGSDNGGGGGSGYIGGVTSGTWTTLTGESVMLSGNSGKAVISF